MKNLLIALALALAATTAACATDDVDTGLEQYQAVEQFNATGGATTRLFDPTVPEPIDVDGSLCACETLECMDQFVADNFGCGLCIDVVCGDGGHAGGCVPCGE
ncbi:MAG TPA: hypothetical protein VL172_05155 [Kofleriaceae bacterium]|nr:hypothetical protein [Kofleriaceae bacterium]